MPTYISLVNFTDQGISTVNETIQRVDSATERAQQFGVSVQSSYWTVGPYDFVITLEAPDDQSVSAFLLDAASRGAVRTTTLRAYDREEMSGIIQRLG